MSGGWSALRRALHASAMSRMAHEAAKATLPDRAFPDRALRFHPYRPDHFAMTDTPAFDTPPLETPPQAVLLIEDDVATSAHTAEQLRQAGWRVETAFDGADGLAQAEPGGFEVIIVDRMLPAWMNCRSCGSCAGVAMTRRCSSSPPWAPSTTGSPVWTAVATTIWSSPIRRRR